MLLEFKSKIKATNFHLFSELEEKNMDFNYSD